jgi:hypothetical protein
LILKANANGSFPINSTHCLRFTLNTNLPAGTVFDWNNNLHISNATCIIPDNVTTDRANGVWGWPESNSIQLVVPSGGSKPRVPVIGNRGKREQMGYSVSDVVAWTVVSPSGQRWATNWQLLP